MFIRALVFFCLAVASAGALHAATPVEFLEQHLQAGTLPAGEAAMKDILKKTPKDAQARFGLGVVQFLRAVEGLGQDLSRYGFLQTASVARAGAMLGNQLPIPINPNPEEIDYQKARQIYQKFVTQLEQAEATLALVDSPDVKLPLHFGQIRLDFFGAGKTTESEPVMLSEVYARMNRAAAIDPEAAKKFVISFDAGDVQWLRGYCHLLMALGETTLAHDFHEIFERSGHLFFTKVKTPYTFLHKETTKEWLAFEPIIDVIATIHLINFPVAEPKRMTTALKHLESMVEVSSKSWDLIVAETDNDNEWIPNSNQESVIPNVKVTQEMIDSWKHFLAEARDILKGDTLIPFWRGKDERGVNLRLVFTDPKSFDLVLWVHGTGAAPYLQKGKVTEPAVWERLNRVFGGEFIGFALWFN
jgi:hypothetical protein